jgi:transglutaminase-like putative cysteine protease
MTADIEPQISAYIGFLLTLRLASLRWPALAPGRWILLPLTLGGVANVFSAYGTFAGQNGGTALLGTMLALKLLEMHRLRDVRVGTILFGFLLVSQFLFDETPLRALYLAVLLIGDVALMADLTARTQSGRRAVTSSVRLAARIGLQALPLALVLFVLFPRLSAPLWNLGPIEEQARTGVKGWLEPGAISDLVIDGRTAFRVWFAGPTPAAGGLYWRGPVLWQSDGRRWTGWPAGMPRAQSTELASAGDEIAYQIELEPSGQRWLFALDLPLSVPGDALLLPDFQLLDSSPVQDARSYRAVSALRYNTGALDPEEALLGTQLPDNVTPRMRDLVDGWLRGAGSPEEVVRRALGLFRQEPFHYTLLPPKLGPNPADEFLFETRKGFCEHYASSFALLMRIAGIPARIVLGYLGGEVNPLGNYLIVRQSDAHAWVEVWLDGQGWVRVDPTAAVDPGRVEPSGLLAGLGSGAPLRFRLDEIDTLRRWAHNLRLLGDALGTGWRDWVLGLSSARQQRMLRWAGLDPLREFGLAIALIIAAGAVVGVLLLALTKPSSPGDPLERIYSVFCRRLARIGLSRRPREGPLDYSRRVIAARPDLRAPVGAFMELYLRLRYGTDGGVGARRELERRLAGVRPRRLARGKQVLD